MISWTWHDGNDVYDTILRDINGYTVIWTGSESWVASGKADLESHVLPDCSDVLLIWLAAWICCVYVV